jgi:Zn-dependent peptidase ImmA (M78 family)/transcriptional regulator with XRE-family HTH domain
MSGPGFDLRDPRLLGRRLMEARKARRLTQEDVAQRLSVARTTVVAIEQGKRRVRPNELIEMADYYGRSLSELTRQGPTVPSFSIQFRAALRPVQPAQAAAIEDAIEGFRRWCTNYAYLETLAGRTVPTAAPAPLPVAGLSPERAGELAARTERNLLGLGDGPVFDLRGLLEEERGLRVFVLDLPDLLAGMFSYSPEYGACIAVNRKHPPERRRWSLAHEYGHYVLSPYEADVLLAQGSGPTATERIADSFAKHFLLPDQSALRRFDQLQLRGEGDVTSADLVGLADYFGVSFQALLLRLEELRRLPRGTCGKLQTLGFRIRETQDQLDYARQPGSDEPFPRRYLLLAVLAFAGARVSEGELAEFLGLDRLSARERAHELMDTIGAEDLETLAAMLSKRLTE